MTTSEHTKPGAIWSALSGYEQTNVSFYRVVSCSAKMIKLQPLKSHQIECDATMTGKAMPTDEPKGEPISRAIKSGTYGPFVLIDRYSMGRVAQPWHGKAMGFSTYA